MSNSSILGGAAVPGPPPAAPAKPAAAKAAPTTRPAAPARRTKEARSAVSVLDRIESNPRNWRKDLTQFLTISAISLVAHAILLMVMWYIVMPAEMKEQILSVLVEQQPIDPEAEVALEQVEMPEELQDLEANSSPIDVPVAKLAEQTSPVEIDINDKELSIKIDSPDLSANAAIKNISNIAGGRSQAGRAAQVAKYGGSTASEAAVASGLKWLASIQRPDGSWSFDEIGDAGNPGTLKECHTGATAMALLCFLGGGHTHETERGEKPSPYREPVAKGLNYLIRSIKLTPDGGDLRGKVVSNEGMYVQGLCTIVLCEAAAMTRDRRLRPVAESAVQFIVRAQDPKGGGWRYSPRQAGDTSVVGWQMMALKSAKNAGIRVPPQVFTGASVFLDAVQDQGGAVYGYTGPQAKPSTTAVGLLCRMYLGWKHDNAALKKGIAFLSKTGPSRNDMYYNYYASQVLRHWGADAPRDTPEWAAWEKFNTGMRDNLVKTQIREGEAAGSWKPTDPHQGPGGRLYQTCLSVMILEVYYRHLPIYDRKNIKVDF